MGDSSAFNETKPSMVRIPAFAVLDGGGVKGIALAGCLAAAKDFGLRFLGYGGTSAGAIVAALSAAGYTPTDLKQIFMDLDFRNEFLGDAGNRLDMARKFAESLQKIFSHKPIALLFAINSLPLILFRNRSILGLLRREVGLYNSQLIEVFIDRLLRKQPQVQRQLLNKNQKSVTFSIVENSCHAAHTQPLPNDCRFLRILVTDLNTQRSRILGKPGTSDFSVASAVAASAAYPFVFSPYLIGDGSAIDGGVSANLPLHVFENERLAHRWPIIAFDLQSEAQPFQRPYSLIRFAQRLLDTSLEASQQPLHELLNFVVHVKVPIPSKFSTLDFSLSPDAKEELYNLGKDHASQQLKEGMESWLSATSERELLQRLYGSPDLVEPVLEAIAHEFERVTPAKWVRCHVMLPTGRGTRIVVYQFGMKGDTDYPIDLELERGVTGKAWQSRSAALGDLADIKNGISKSFVLPHDQRHLIPEHRKAMLAVPIPHPRVEDCLPMGTLAVDTNTTYAESGWAQCKFKWPTEDTAANRLSMWARIVAGLIL